MLWPFYLTFPWAVSVSSHNACNTVWNAFPTTALSSTDCLTWTSVMIFSVQIHTYTVYAENWTYVLCICIILWYTFAHSKFIQTLASTLQCLTDFVINNNPRLRMCFEIWVVQGLKVSGSGLEHYLWLKKNYTHIESALVILKEHVHQQARRPFQPLSTIEQ